MNFKLFATKLCADTENQSKRDCLDRLNYTDVNSIFAQNIDEAADLFLYTKEATELGFGECSLYLVTDSGKKVRI